MKFFICLLLHHVFSHILLHLFRDRQMNMLAILTMSMRNMLAILMLFHLDIPNISLFHLNIPNIALFPSMVVDLVTRDGTPCARSIFDVYILLHDPCLITRNRNLRLKEKKLYTLFIYTIRSMTHRDALREAPMFGC